MQVLPRPVLMSSRTVEQRRRAEISTKRDVMLLGRHGKNSYQEKEEDAVKEEGEGKKKRLIHSENSRINSVRGQKRSSKLFRDGPKEKGFVTIQLIF